MSQVAKLLFIIIIFFVSAQSPALMTSTYPNRTVTLICPWAPGGGSDQVARKVAALLENQFKQRVLVVNRTGGGGVIGLVAGATAVPDGYTLVLGTTEIAIMHWLGQSDISYRDFIPVALVNTDPASILVRADAPWKTIEQLQTAIKKNPGKLRASGTAKGGIWDLCRAGWLNALQLKENVLPWIPSQGAAPALQRLMTGEVDIVTCSLPEAAGLIESGKVRPLALMGEQRDPKFPTVPTLTEKGVSFSNGSFRGIVVPLGTPKPVVVQLEQAMALIANSREFIEFMNERKFGFSYKNATEFGIFLKNKDRLFGKLISELELTANLY